MSSVEQTTLSRRLRSAEARLLECMSKSQDNCKKQIQHQYRRWSKDEAKPEVKPEVQEEKPVQRSFNVGSVRRVRKIEDDFPDSDDEEEFPPIPVPAGYAASVNGQMPAREYAASIMSARARRPSSRASNLPYGARRVSRLSWSTQDFQEYMDREKQQETLQPTSQVDLSQEPPSINRLPSPIQRLKYDVKPAKSMTLASTASIPTPVRRARSIVEAEQSTPSRPSSASGFVTANPRPSRPTSASGYSTSRQKTTQPHRRVYSDFNDPMQPRSSTSSGKATTP